MVANFCSIIATDIYRRKIDPQAERPSRNEIMQIVGSVEIDLSKKQVVSII